MSICSAFLVLAGLLLASVSSEAVQYVSETPKTFSASLPSDPRLVVGFVSDRSKLPGPRKDLASRPQYAMTASDGKQFTCYTYNETAPPSQELQPLQGPIFPPFPQKSPFELLDALTGLCLYRQQGLWTYSWCHKSEVYQLRQDKASKPKERFSLGSWPGEDAQVEDVKVDETIASVPVKYVSHNFTGGDTCLLNGEPRTAEVRFTCMKDVKDSIIFSVNEFPTCNYVFVVATPFLCKHPEFKPQPEAVSSIVCAPQKSSDEDHHDIMTASSPHTTEGVGTDVVSGDISGTASEPTASSVGAEEVGAASEAAAEGLGGEEVEGDEGSKSASGWQDAQKGGLGVESKDCGEAAEVGGHRDALEGGKKSAESQGVEDRSVGDAVGDRIEGRDQDHGLGESQNLGAAGTLGGEEHVGKESIGKELGVEEGEGVDGGHRVGVEVSDRVVEAGREESAWGDQTDRVESNFSEQRNQKDDGTGHQERSGVSQGGGGEGEQEGVGGYNGWKWQWLEGQWHWLPEEGASLDEDTGGHGPSDVEGKSGYSEDVSTERSGRTEL
ncbi:hypothetical protein DUNSADRAFT_4363 [Dunaliella salina]|uniref:MRH domain-containing protein n=1 Tax=Dunaliella salina TaxID=3046 RepID=A0ABQ7GS60_DUNSA|nr:hypothetical protein DUNSADRAFT_4363 [Dunaliella salina]|eukprot:KAF5837447.1 hypothetical protein DUNSADRAFT_4363 [Dunaliella salina]